LGGRPNALAPPAALGYAARNDRPAGADMRLLLGLFVASALLAMAGLAALDVRFRSSDHAMRAIHYDKNLDLSAQRRTRER
jgi:hypothetical protein